MSSTTRSSARPNLFWVAIIALPAIAIIAAFGLRLAGLASTDHGSAPRFVIDPSAPVDKTSVAETAAALSQELTDLKKRLGIRGPERTIDDLVSSGDAGDGRSAIRKLFSGNPWRG